MDNSGAATALALIVVMSFAVDRIVAGLIFLLSFSSAWVSRFPAPALISEDGPRAKAERDNKLAYFAIAAALCIGILAAFPNVRIIRTLGLSQAASASVMAALGEQNKTASPTPTATQTATATPQGNASPGATGSPNDRAASSAATPFWPPAESIFDFVVTALILMGGAERIAALIKVPGAAGGEKPAEHPIQVTGKLTLEDGGAGKSA
jgi:hypothetical protein